MTPDVIVVGGDLAGFPTLDGDVVSAVFDEDTDTWTLTTADGETCRSRIVLACTSPFVPWIPDLFGRRAFRGVSFHAAEPVADFDAAGQRIAVIGTDATAGRLIGRLTRSGATVKVFALPPRRFIRQTGRARRYLRRQPELVTSPIDELTAAGIRTADGVHHDADVIVYGTGFAVRAGLPPETLVGTGGQTIQQAWVNGSEPYLGIALHGFPNYFIVDGPVLECLQLIKGHTRIEVRLSSQQVFNERVHLHAARHRGLASAFDVSSPSEGVHNDTYDGPATLTAAGTSERVRLRLIGHVDPIDGQYHWQGTVFDELSAALTRASIVTVAVRERSAPARIIEETPQGTHMIAGVGAPPFATADIELCRPQR
jgi:cation diffusion facilitator CzcD-associated flavoprotein CzcO